MTEEEEEESLKEGNCNTWIFTRQQLAKYYSPSEQEGMSRDRIRQEQTRGCHFIILSGMALQV